MGTRESTTLPSDFDSCWERAERTEALSYLYRATGDLSFADKLLPAVYETARDLERGGRLLPPPRRFLIYYSVRFVLGGIRNLPLVPHRTYIKAA
jgi:hypothetical protein